MSETESIQVSHAGALKNFMQEGDISAKASLDTLNPVDLYGLGALENLQGELIILDGKPYLSRVVDGNVVIEKSYDAKASLLVYSQVSEWHEYKVRESINSLGELESLVEEYAVKEGVNIEKAFPFMIKGKMDSFRWHIVNWPREDTVHTHKKHINSGLRGKEEKRNVTLLGFYSRHHRTVFTHQTSDMHIHVLTDDLELGAHVDALVLGKKFSIFLPK